MLRKGLGQHVQILKVRQEEDFLQVSMSLFSFVWFFVVAGCFLALHQAAYK